MVKRTDDVTRVVGTTTPFRIQFPDDATGNTFRLAANVKADPLVADVNIFDIAGVIDTGDASVVLFTPTTQEASPNPRRYYYQVRRENTSSGAVDFPSEGTILFRQSIAK